MSVVKTEEEVEEETEEKARTVVAVHDEDRTEVVSEAKVNTEVADEVLGEIGVEVAMVEVGDTTEVVVEFDTMVGAKAVERARAEDASVTGIGVEIVGENLRVEVESVRETLAPWGSLGKVESVTVIEVVVGTMVEVGSVTETVVLVVTQVESATETEVVGETEVEEVTRVGVECATETEVVAVDEVRTGVEVTSVTGTRDGVKDGTRAGVESGTATGVGGVSGVEGSVEGNTKAVDHGEGTDSGTIGPTDKGSYSDCVTVTRDQGGREGGDDGANHRGPELRSGGVVEQGEK